MTGARTLPRALREAVPQACVASSLLAAAQLSEGMRARHRRHLGNMFLAFVIRQIYEQQ